MLVHIKGKKTAKVPSFARASHLVREAWHGGRSSVFYADRTAGLIENDEGEVIAHVSFNGRVWQGADRLTSSPEIVL